MQLGQKFSASGAGSVRQQKAVFGRTRSAVTDTDRLAKSKPANEIAVECTQTGDKVLESLYANF